MVYVIVDVLIGLYLIAGALVSTSLVLTDQAKSPCSRDDILYGIFRYIGAIIVWPIVLLVMAISSIE